MSDFYFDVTLSSQEADSKLKKAIDQCQDIHKLAIEFINDYFLANTRIPALKEFYPTYSYYVSTEKPLEHTQRYSLTRAVEQTFPFAAEQIKVQNRKIILAKPLENYNTIQIQKRRIWHKYLALYGFITTIYGTIYPQGKWKAIVREQAENVPADVIPFLWHSVSVMNDNEQWKMRFNLHQVETPLGQKAQERYSQYYG